MSHSTLEARLKGVALRAASALGRISAKLVVPVLIVVGCSTSSPTVSSEAPAPATLVAGFLQDGTTVGFNNDCFSDLLVVDDGLIGTTMELVPVGKVPTAGLVSVSFLDASGSQVGAEVRDPEFFGDDLGYASAGVFFPVPPEAVKADVTVCGASKDEYVFQIVSQETDPEITPGSNPLFADGLQWFVDGCEDATLTLDPRLEQKAIQIVVGNSENGIHFVRLLALDAAGKTITTIFDDVDHFVADPLRNRFEGGSGVIPSGTRSVSLWVCGSGEVQFNQVP